MSYSFGISNNNPKDFLVTFLQSRGFMFRAIEELKDYQNNFFFIIDKDTKFDLNSEIKKTLHDFGNISFLFLHSKLKNNSFLDDYKKIYYPIKIDDYEKIIEKIENVKSFFLDIKMSNNNFIKNTLNNQMVHLTELEFRILERLFADKLVKKEKLKTEILQFHVSLETKSLDSHLSRIRKKLQKIDSKILITSHDNFEIKIS